METMRVLECVQQLSQYLRQMNNNNENISNIMRILVRYIEVSMRYRFNPITPNCMHLLNTYIESIQDVIPADILIKVQAAVIVIQNDHTTQDANTYELAQIQDADESVQSQDADESECDRYETLRRGANRIRQKLIELESTPNTDPNHVSMLTTHLVNIIKYTSDFEKKYGGGASKF